MKQLGSFTAGTDRVGARRWIRVVVHPTLQHMYAAGMRTTSQEKAKNKQFWEGCLGCFQPTSFYKEGRLVHWPANGFAGTLRLVRGHITSEIVAHELMHAALAVYRIQVKANVRLGPGYGSSFNREEDLAYIYGQLFANVQDKLNELIEKVGE